MSSTTATPPAFDPYEPLWIAKDVARYGRVSIGTVRNWASDDTRTRAARKGKPGNLPSPVRLGSTVRWRPADIIRHFEPEA